MNRIRLVLTLFVVTSAALVSAQQEDIRPEMRPELKAHENKIDLRLIMSPQEFRGTGLHKLTNDEIESLNLWVENLLVEMRGKMDQPIQEARPIPAKPSGARTPRKPVVPSDGR